MVAEQPEVALASDGIERWLLRSRIVDLAGRVAAELSEQCVDVVVRVTDAFEAVLGAQLSQQFRQRRLVPRRVLVAAVVGDCERGRVEVAPVEPDDGDSRVPELLGSLEPRVAGDDLARALGDDGLLPAEAADRGGDVGDGFVVAARVRRAAVEPLDRDQLDVQGRHVHTNSVQEVFCGAWSWCAPRGALWN